MSLVNIVIHMLFASTVALSVAWEGEDKITLWRQQGKSSNEYLNKVPVTLQVVLDVDPSSRSQCSPSLHPINF